MTLAGFNLLRWRCLRPVYLCEFRWHFPRVKRKYLGEKAAENLQSLQGYDPANLHSLTVYFAMLKKNYVV